jgi:hypothetical protein
MIFGKQMDDNGVSGSNKNSNGRLVHAYFS